MKLSKSQFDTRYDVESWLEKASKIPAIEFVPVENNIAIKSTQLSEHFHRDPADRMLVA